MRETTGEAVCWGTVECNENITELLEEEAAPDGSVTEVPDVEVLEGRLDSCWTGGTSADALLDDATLVLGEAATEVGETIPTTTSAKNNNICVINVKSNKYSNYCREKQREEIIKL